tara:strand:+ start:87 stop:614 length:528 start_codon:yes stop_codon:yes gene_type:complete
VELLNIESDLRSWSREVLEVPNDHLKGLPPCPYAKQAWKQNKVLVVEGDDITIDALRYCNEFYDLSKELVVVASFNIPDLQEFSAFVEGLNKDFKKLHCMQFHPDFGAEDAELDFLYDNDWDSNLDRDYCMVFIQDLRLVVNASDKLEKLGYYNAYPRSEYNELVVKRKERLQWL